MDTACLAVIGCNEACQLSSLFRSSCAFCMQVSFGKGRSQTQHANMHPRVLWRYDLAGGLPKKTATMLRSFAATSHVLKKAMPPRPTLPDSELHHVYLKGSGPGGQKINKTNSACQLTHIPTGIVVKSQATRSRSQNHNIARRILAEKIELLERGDQSRAAIKMAAASRKKASKRKKSLRKYKKLEAHKEDEDQDAEEDNDGEDTQHHDRATMLKIDGNSSNTTLTSSSADACQEVATTESVVEKAHIS